MNQTTKLEEPGVGSLRRLRFSLLALWVIAVLFAGAVLTSQHQPFRISDKVPTALFRPSATGKWRVVHVLSGSCGCSQRVMQHLAQRHQWHDFEEEVTVIDDGTPYLPESPQLLLAVQRDGFPVRHLRLEDLPRDARLYGVPMLVVASPSGQIAYAGGYGTPENDVNLLRSAHAGRRTAALPLLGCAVGRALQRKADPFQVKYPTLQPPLALASASSAAPTGKGNQ